MDGSQAAVLRENVRFVSHMRAERNAHRFGLVLGAGVSQPLHYPSWSELVSRVADHPDVKGRHVISTACKVPETSKTQMLFQHFRSKLQDEDCAAGAKFDREVQGKWRRIIHECLYRDVPTTPDEIRSTHPYLKDFLEVISSSMMTVNYNFDDTIQQLLLHRFPTGTSNSTRQFETVWNACLPFRQDTAVIYHPNGFLPRNLLEYPSETLVFSDDSFADQLIESMAGHHASLLHHFSKTTSLFIGLSLQDMTLRHLLRQSAVISPGHYHYYIHWRPKGEARNPAVEKALREANFEVYNLITLFLDDDEISALGSLLTMSDTDIRREADELGVELKYFYYLTGPIGAGKTTCVSYFGSLKPYEEWAEARPENLGKSWKDLTIEERDELDRWIMRQFNLKNYALLEQTQGIHIVDRTPLDPLAFSETTDMPKKAASIYGALRPGKATRPIQGGHIILLTGEPEDLEVRVVGRHKQSRADTIQDMQDKLKTIFDGHHCTVVNTFGLSISQVVKRVARLIFLEDYTPTDLSQRLSDIGGSPQKGPQS